MRLTPVSTSRALDEIGKIDSAGIVVDCAALRAVVGELPQHVGVVAEYARPGHGGLIVPDAAAPCVHRPATPPPAFFAPLACPPTRAVGRGCQGMGPEVGKFLRRSRHRAN